jgi:hypothetical protein
VELVCPALAPFVYSRHVDAQPHGSFRQLQREDAAYSVETRIGFSVDITVKLHEAFVTRNHFGGYDQARLP